MNKDFEDKSTYYYSKAIWYNNQLDEVISLLEDYSNLLSTKLVNASCLLDENSSLYNGIDLYINQIKKEVLKCNDAINSMKSISISKAIARDDDFNNSMIGGEKDDETNF